MDSHANDSVTELWRLMLVAGFSMGTLRKGEPFDLQGLERMDVVVLTVVTEGLALLTLGLVRPWGERVPGWIPHVGGRHIPPRPVKPSPRPAPYC
ncbi:MAG: hypothetical protein ACRDQD_26160 [Nocardioidaceae bacterium]